jgi:hypothetical protein
MFHGEAVTSKSVVGVLREHFDEGGDAIHGSNA